MITFLFISNNLTNISVFINYANNFFGKSDYTICTNCKNTRFQTFTELNNDIFEKVDVIIINDSSNTKIIEDLINNNASDKPIFLFSNFKFTITNKYCVYYPFIKYDKISSMFETILNEVNSYIEKSITSLFTNNVDTELDGNNIDNNLENINLENINLENINLGNINLGNINLGNINLENTNLENTNLEDTNLENTNLEDNPCKDKVYIDNRPDLNTHIIKNNTSKKKNIHYN